MSKSDGASSSLKDFLSEAEEILESLGQDIADMADCADSGECSPDLLNKVFRAAHSLKGLAGMFGYSSIQKLSHVMENLLDSLRLGKVELSQELVNVLYESVEILSGMIQRLSTVGDDNIDYDDTAEKINSLIARKETGKSGNPLESIGLSPQILNSLTEYEEHRLLENIKKSRHLYSITASFDLSSFDQDLAALTDILKKNGEVISTLPSVSDSDDSGINFEIICGTQKSLGELASTVESSAITVRELGGVPSSSKALKQEETRSPLVSNIPQEPQKEAASLPLPPAEKTETPASGRLLPPDSDSLSAKSISQTVRVDISKLDELMNIVGELVLCHSLISDLSIELRQESFSNNVVELGKATKNLERKLTELQKGVMDIRMIPIGQLYEKMGRIVRKISREQGKKVDLKMFGAETELDKLIIEDISDPLMHIIRNSIDHGIEMPEERLLKGKDDKGTITLSSFQKGNHVVIEVVDDGKGMDADKIRRKAFEKGLIQSPESLSDREALELIFLPGFSTADKISDVSGRGVGMDVVRNNIARISGIVDIESASGRGSKVIITLPITLAIIKSLIIEASGRTFAMPITSVMETIIVNRSSVLTVERRKVIQLREMTLPLLSLSDFFGLERSSEFPDEFYVVVVGVAEKRLGLVVNNLTGQRDIVIKPLGETFKGFRGISGAADLGDQRTILVLDVGGIIGEATRNIQLGD